MIKTKRPKTTVKNDALKRHIERMAKDMKRNSPHVKVGVLADAGEHSDGLRVVDIATMQEFGTETIPERSYIRSTARENRKKYMAIVQKIFRKGLTGELKIEKGLAVLGERIQADIVNKIVSGISPALKASTIRMKGSTTPLIDTGQLKASIRYRVMTR